MKSTCVLKLRKIGLLLCIFHSIFFLNIAFSDTPPIQPIAPAVAKQRFVNAYIKLNITSQNNASYCSQGGAPPNTGHGIWGDHYTLCPANSVTSTVPSVDSNSVHNCVCGSGCPSNLGRYGNAGLQVSNILCLVPVSLWLPETVFTSGGTGQSVIIYGTNTYVTTYGTQIFLQPSSTTNTYNVTVNGDATSATMTGPNAAFLSNFINNTMFNILDVTFPGCAMGTGC